MEMKFFVLLFICSFTNIIDGRGGRPNRDYCSKWNRIRNERVFVQTCECFKGRRPQNGLICARIGGIYQQVQSKECIGGYRGAMWNETQVSTGGKCYDSYRKVVLVSSANSKCKKTQWFRTYHEASCDGTWRIKRTCSKRCGLKKRVEVRGCYEGENKSYNCKGSNLSTFKITLCNSPCWTNWKKSNNSKTCGDGFYEETRTCISRGEFNLDCKESQTRNLESRCRPVEKNVQLLNTVEETGNVLSYAAAGGAGSLFILVVITGAIFCFIKRKRALGKNQQQKQSTPIDVIRPAHATPSKAKQENIYCEIDVSPKVVAYASQSTEGDCKTRPDVPKIPELYSAPNNVPLNGEPFLETSDNSLCSTPYFDERRESLNSYTDHYTFASAGDC